MRRALENSRNLATAHLLTGAIDKKPEDSLNRLCDLAVEAQIYGECVRYYPFVLGAQPVRPIDLAAFYAAIANEGLRPAPYVVESIERDGQTIYRHQQTTSPIDSVDRAAFYQLKTMLQGVLARGTARAIADLSPYVAGKTGTSDDENDAWFVGFTNDVTVAVWIGYDNADGKRRTLGGGSTGGAVAVPIFDPIIHAVWTDVAAKTELADPSPEAERQLSCKSIDLESGDIRTGRGRAFSECFRVNAKGKVVDTQYLLLSGKSARAKRDGEVSPSGKRARAKGKADQKYAKQDPAVRRSNKDARASRASAPVQTPYSWNDPWRAQWNWQGQYGQTYSWGRWR